MRNFIVGLVLGLCLAATFAYAHIDESHPKDGSCRWEPLAEQFAATLKDSQALLERCSRENTEYVARLQECRRTQK